jgi:hypothetical protein
MKNESSILQNNWTACSFDSISPYAKEGKAWAVESELEEFSGMKEPV